MKGRCKAGEACVYLHRDQKGTANANAAIQLGERELSADAKKKARKEKRKAKKAAKRASAAVAIDAETGLPLE